MITDDFVDGMVRLSMLFKNFELNNEQLNAWYPFFENIKADDFENAIDHLAITSDYEPTIRRLIEAVKEVQSSTKSHDVEDIWFYIRHLISTKGFNYNSETIYEELEAYDPLVAKVVKVFEREFASLNELTSEELRKRFQRYYLHALKRKQYDDKVELITGQNLAIGVTHEESSAN